MKRVVIGMSGGVDSSVAAIILKEQGYEIIGITMKLYEKENNCSTSTDSDAKMVCDKLGIQHYTLNFEEEFKKDVIQNFVCEYENARTPNPCVECNKYLKFGLMYKKALELGCNYIATGHYAKIEYAEKFNQYVIKKSDEENKDQTYFLYGIPREALSHILFPLQNLKTKQETRKITFLLSKED